MLKNLIIFFYCSIALLLLIPSKAFALENPLSVPNNKFGIHILFTSELADAAKLVNSNGGDWGYVTIPIQAGDKDIPKWQGFMDDARRLHIIPLIRLATEGDYFNTKVWRQPNASDVLDFANFLNSLNWPTKNRYVIIFNEVNRADEWGGRADPKDYANLLTYAVTTFKSKSPDFFIISAGLDNAAADTGDTYNQFSFLGAMNQAVPGIFNQIDGIASHSYPNPAFAQPPTILTQESISSFSYEKNYIKNMSSKDFPIFITETGWDQGVMSAEKIGTYFQQAFSSVWNDPSIVAVTPFLLKAGGGPFVNFSFVDANGNPDGIYKSVFNILKVKGLPALAPAVLAASSKNISLPTKDFSNNTPSRIAFSFPSAAKIMLKWFLLLPML